MESLRIVEATSEQLDDIVGLWRELMTYHEKLDSAFSLKEGADVLFREFARQHIEDFAGVIFVAYIDNAPVGYAMARIENVPPVFARDRVALLQDMLVTEKYRRSGIGKLLTQRVVEWAKANGEDVIQLYVASTNAAGIAFWQQMGFREQLKTMRLDAKNLGAGTGS